VVGHVILLPVHDFPDDQTFEVHPLGRDYGITSKLSRSTTNSSSRRSSPRPRRSETSRQSHCTELVSGTNWRGNSDGGAGELVSQQIAAASDFRRR